MDLIVEMIQGNVQHNITTFLGKTFIYDMCRILTEFNSRYHLLPRGFGLDPYEESFFDFKSNIIQCFKIMLENKSEKNLAILKAHLDFGGLMTLLGELINRFVKDPEHPRDVEDMTKLVHDLDTDDYKDVLGTAMDIYMMFRYLWPTQDSFIENINELLKGENEEVRHKTIIGSGNERVDKALVEKFIYGLFRHIIGSVEIVMPEKDPSLFRVWFPIIAPCHYLSNDAKEYFLKHVDRSNSQSKLSELMEATHEFIPQMRTELASKNRFLGLNTKALYEYLRIITNIIALGINLTNLFTYNIDPETEIISQSSTHATIVSRLNDLQIVIAVALVVFWFPLNFKREMSVAWQRYVEQNIKAHGAVPPSILKKLEEGDEEKLVKLFDDRKSEIEILMNQAGPNSNEFKIILQNPRLFEYIKNEYYVKMFHFVRTTPALVWHVIYAFICFGSLFHPLVNVFQVFDIAIRADAVQQISLAIVKNKSQFLWTLILLLISTLLYSTIGFFFINDSMVQDDARICVNNFECFLNVLNIGLRAGGGIADGIKHQPYDEGHEKWVGRILYDLSFFVLVITLLLNLIFGMIIDAFGDLRDQKTSDEEDQKNTCFICGVERSEYEKIANFDDHCRDDHNIWNYVYYVTYVEEKYATSKNDMTDIENFVFECYHKNDENWMPIGKRSLTLENSEIQNQEKSVEETVKESMELVKEDFSKELTKVSQMMKNMEVEMLREVRKAISNLAKQEDTEEKSKAVDMDRKSTSFSGKTVYRNVSHHTVSIRK